MQDARLELSKSTQDRNDIRFFQIQPHVAELRTSHKLHKNIFGLRSIVRQRRIIVSQGEGSKNQYMKGSSMQSRLTFALSLLSILKL